MADTSVKLSGTYDSIEAYNIMVEMQNMSADYEEIRTEAAAAASAATAAVATATAAVTTAQTAAINAGTYADNANTYAGNAAASASTATTQAGNAADSATAASNSATAAAASESNAATSEANAAASEAAAAASEAAVDTAIDTQFLSQLYEKLQTTGALPSGTSFPSTTVLSKMIANMNAEDGVRYNFSNSNAWYICLGAKFGGLIIQGGKTSNTPIVLNNGKGLATFSLNINFQQYGWIYTTSGHISNVVYQTFNSATQVRPVCESTSGTESFEWCAIGF